MPMPGVLLTVLRFLDYELSRKRNSNFPEPSRFGSFESCDPSPDKSISWRTPLEGGFGKPENGVVPARDVSVMAREVTLGLARSCEYCSLHSFDSRRSLYCSSDALIACHRDHGWHALLEVRKITLGWDRSRQIR
jgi:hypothetical protein